MEGGSRACENGFGQIFNLITTGIAVYEAVDNGADFIFKDINAAGTLIGKMPREAHLGRRVTEVYPGVGRMGLLDVLRTVWQTGIPQRFPLCRYQDDRIELWVENYVFRLPSGHVVAVYEDRTSEKKAEQEKTELLKHIHRIQRIESLATLAAGIAHDFNNLLMPIMGYAQMGMDRSPPDQSVSRYFQRILDASQRAKQLVSQILLLSREDPHGETATDLVPIFKECVKFLRSGVPKNVDIVYGALPETAPVRADPAELHQILMNLTVNAYHAVRGKAGKVCLELECPCINERMLSKVPRPEGLWVHLSVMDNGPGVPVDLREKIFEPYFTTKKPEEGTGLGLFITSGVVRRLGGAVWVEDAPEGGAAFHVLLPGADKAAPAETAPQEIEDESWDVHVLAVDDEPDVLSVLKSFLTPKVRRLTLAETPEKAVAIFQQSPRDFDMVLTDYSMPKMTGLDVARSVKALRPDVPVVLLTGYRCVEDLLEKEDVHLVERLVYKPVTQKDLIRVLKDVLSPSLKGKSHGRSDSRGG